MKLYPGTYGHVLVEQSAINGMYTVTLRGYNGHVTDKVRTDSYRAAMEYKRAFVRITNSAPKEERHRATHNTNI